jgi:hypothetical protein
MTYVKQHVRTSKKGRTSEVRAHIRVSIEKRPKGTSKQNWYSIVKTRPDGVAWTVADANTYAEARKKAELIKVEMKMFPKVSKMSVSEARSILGDRSTWELHNMKKALSFAPILNTEEENKRLTAVKVMLREGKKGE